MITKNLVVFGLGQRGNIYATFAKTFPDKFNLVAIIENDKKRIDYAKNTFKNVKVFSDYKEFLLQNIKADLVAISTQDESHKEHAIAMMRAGYDLLLEKPIANNKKDCLAIYKVSKKLNRKVIVCHVLRYSPFYSTIKKIIDSGRLGNIVTVEASENVGFFHQAHSFVRGPWRNKELSSPMILAKCCHDMDILRYLIGENCLSINSIGELSYFKRENMPVGASHFCSDCKVKNCIYKAQKLYLTEECDFFANYFTTKEHTKENVLHDLKYSDYDRCVFDCDNNVVDHQISIIKFANGKTACHSMTAFSKDIYRDIKIHGTKAELYGVMEQNFVEIRSFGGDTERINIDISEANVGGHNGGDFFMMNSVFNALNGQKAEGVTYLDVSIDSHLMSFNAELSRLKNGKTIKIRK